MGTDQDWMWWAWKAEQGVSKSHAAPTARKSWWICTPCSNTHSSIPTGKHPIYSTRWFSLSRGSVLRAVFHCRGLADLHTKVLLFTWLSLQQCPYRKPLGNTRHIPAEIIRAYPVWPFKNRLKEQKWTTFLNHSAEIIQLFKVLPDPMLDSCSCT